MQSGAPNAKPLHEWTATEIALAIRERRASSVDVTRYFLDRIKKLNPAINAVVALREAEALEEARAADLAVERGEAIGQLHGVPLTVKDMHRMAGSRTTYGLPQYRNYIPRKDSWIVSRVRAAGAVIIGRTNVPVSGFDWQCWNPNYGRTCNPWNSGHTCGGSSGGAAAAVAARLSPMEIGSDIAGSIRYPSHCCGVLGLRPTDGRVPNWGVGPEDLPAVFRHFLTSGPVARSLDDLELGLDLLSPGGARFPDASHRPLRVAWAESLPGMEHVRPEQETCELLRGFIGKLESAGHSVETAVPSGIDFTDATELWGEIAGFEFLAGLPRPALWLGFRYWMSLGLASALFGRGALSTGFSRGLRSSPRKYFEALSRRDELMMKWAEFKERFDLWITPVSPSGAIAHHRFGKSFRHEGRKVSYVDYMGSYLASMGTIGHPILTIPIGMTRDGLPIGVQIHGGRNQDEKLLRDVRSFQRLLPELPAPPGFA